MGVPEKFLEGRNHVLLIAYSLSDSLLYPQLPVHCLAQSQMLPGSSLENVCWTDLSIVVRFGLVLNVSLKVVMKGRMRPGLEVRLAE